MTRLVEVGPRDGLQNEVATVPTDVKIAFVDALSQSGLTEIEASAFVSPKWVPQLSDAAEVFAHIERRAGVVYSALVPNEQGLDRALEARVDKIALFTAASQSFNVKNVNTTVEGSLERFAPIMRRAGELGLPVRGYVSTAFWCPYEGKVAPAEVLRVCEDLAALGVEELAVGDTIGRASKEDVERLLDALQPVFEPERLAMHFHDTFGLAIENVVTSYRRGIRTFDASTGGLGGCPYAPGATGNVPTATVVQTLRQLGATVDVDLEKLDAAWKLVVDSVGHGERPLPSQRSPT
jgi:hydroxymethylglutaryl-CoA lyase